MATHDSQDLDRMQRNVEHELREALRLGRHHVAVEHDEPGFAVGSNDTAAPLVRERTEVSERRVTHKVDNRGCRGRATLEPRDLDLLIKEVQVREDRPPRRDR